MLAVVPQPMIRASQVKANLTGLERLGAGAERRVRERMSPETVEAIELATRVAWLPIELDVELCEAVDREVGRSRLWEWQVEAALESMRGPLLSPLVTGAVRLFGPKPGRLLKFASRAWSQVYRDCGEVELGSASDSAAVLEYRGGPDVVVADAMYLSTIAAGFSSVFLVLELTGDVDVDAADRDCVRFRFSW